MTTWYTRDGSTFGRVTVYRRQPWLRFISSHRYFSVDEVDVTAVRTSMFFRLTSVVWYCDVLPGVYSDRSANDRVFFF